MSECNGYRGEVGSDDTVSEARLPQQLTTAVLSVVELAKHFLQLHHLQTTTQRRVNHSSPGNDISTSTTFTSTSTTTFRFCLTGLLVWN